MTESSIVKISDGIFEKLKWLCFEFNTDTKTEIFVFTLTVLSIIWFLISIFTYPVISKNIYLKIVYLIIPFYSIFNTIIYQINVLLFDYRRKIRNNDTYKVGGHTRLFILLGLNYFTVIFSLS